MICFLYYRKPVLRLYSAIWHYYSKRKQPLTGGFYLFRLCINHRFNGCFWFRISLAFLSGKTYTVCLKVFEFRAVWICNAMLSVNRWTSFCVVVFMHKTAIFPDFESNVKNFLRRINFPLFHYFYVSFSALINLFDIFNVIVAFVNDLHKLYKIW